jgi:hypothetical protein
VAAVSRIDIGGVAAAPLADHDDDDVRDIGG